MTPSAWRRRAATTILAFMVALALGTMATTPRNKTSSSEPMALPIPLIVPITGVQEPIAYLAPEANGSWSGVPASASISPKAGQKCQTVNAWVRITRDFPHARQWGVLALRASQPDNVYMLSISRHSARFGMCQNCAGGGATAPAGPLLAEGWHMLTGILSTVGPTGGDWTVLIDGTPAASQPIAGTRVMPGNPSHAAVSDRPGTPSGITASDVFVYDRCLSPAEILQLYRDGMPSPQAGDKE